jgi:hypothetical protein
MLLIKPVSLKQAVQRLFKVYSKDCACPSCALMLSKSSSLLDLSNLLSHVVRSSSDLAPPTTFDCWLSCFLSLLTHSAIPALTSTLSLFSPQFRAPSFAWLSLRTPTFLRGCQSSPACLILHLNCISLSASVFPVRSHSTEVRDGVLLSQNDRQHKRRWNMYQHSSLHSEADSYLVTDNTLSLQT